MNKIKVSICVTIFNESKETVKKLLDALESQTLKPDEIIIIDAKDYDNCSRAKGRNIAIKKAKNEIIAITDAGCVPHKDWLVNLIKPFSPTTHKATRGTDVVSGGYKMIASNSFEKAEAVFLGVNQKDMKSNFLPSARSMAFTKTIWKKAGGFPERLENTAEDTLFNIELLKSGAKLSVAKKAIVDWQMPETLKEFAKKIYNYAKGDIESGIWWHPIKKWKTHNIKILTIFTRYAFGFWLLAIGRYDYLSIYLILYSAFGLWKASLWGIILQPVSDFAAMTGFLKGII